MEVSSDDLTQLGAFSQSTYEGRKKATALQLHGLAIISPYDS
jgi:hypothetical protein